MRFARLTPVSATLLVALAVPVFAGQAPKATTPAASAQKAPTATPPAAAPISPTKEAHIKELLHVLKVDQLSSEITDGANGQIDQLGHQIFGATETPEQQKKLSDLHTKVLGIVSPAISWPVLEPEFVQAYNSSYTDAQIDGILAFYKSPSGQALLDKGPDIGRRSNQIVSGRMATVQPQLRTLVQDFVRENRPAPAAEPDGDRAPAPGAAAPAPRPAPSLTPPASK